MIPTLNHRNNDTFERQLGDFLTQYSAHNEPIEVSFRNLVADLSKADIATHLIHTYPAKLLMHIPHFFLNNNILSKEGDTVLDPFCGSGTVLLEAILAKRKALGADANPLARLIAKVKTTKLDTKVLKGLLDRFKEAPIRACDEPNFANVDYWFLPETKKSLSHIFSIIESIEDLKYQEFFKVCFSNCVKKVSLADQRVSVPVRLKAERYEIDHPFYDRTRREIEEISRTDAIAKFYDIVETNIARVESLNNLLKGSKSSAKIVSDDARQLQSGKDGVKDFSVSLIITSPPYAGAQKYIRSSGLSLGWLKFIDEERTIKHFDSLNIGRENYIKSQYKNLPKTNIEQADSLLSEIYEKNPLRAYIAANYLLEMRDAFKECMRVLKPKGFFVLIAANNQVCGFEFKTQEFLMQIAQDCGFTVILRMIDDIKSYGLMTKRNKTANIITREWVLIFQKK